MSRIFILVATVGAIFAAPGLAFAHYQPHMIMALQELQAAEQDIAIADESHDHGGYAGAATHDINQAIQNVRTGIAYRDANGP